MAITKSVLFPLDRSRPYPDLREAVMRWLMEPGVRRVYHQPMSFEDVQELGLLWACGFIWAQRDMGSLSVFVKLNDKASAWLATCP
jgi:hypothetical protein